MWRLLVILHMPFVCSIATSDLNVALRVYLSNS